MRSRICLGLIFAAIGCQAKSDGSADAPLAPSTVVVESLHFVESGLHNTFRVSAKIYSGSSPESDSAFEALRKLGIKTIISVDGAMPDADAARRHGLRYVHLPIGYDGIPRDRVLQLVRAVTDLPGPIYVHCHHGKHRGPAAVGVIQLCTDPAWDANLAEEWLKTAGTDPRYTGLTILARSLVRPTPEELTSVPAEFPDHTPVGDLARIMVEIDLRWDHLKLVKQAGWSVPQNHPDIDPAHEAMQLLEHYREAARLASVTRRGPAFASLLVEAEAAASALETGLRAHDGVRASAAFIRSAATCATCHNQFRDKPQEKK